MRLGILSFLCLFAMEQNGTKFGLYWLFLVRFTKLTEAYSGQKRAIIGVFFIVANHVNLVPFIKKWNRLINYIMNWLLIIYG